MRAWMLLPCLAVLLISACEIDGSEAVEAAEQAVRDIGESIDIEAIGEELDTLFHEIGEAVDIDSIKNDLDSLIVDIEQGIKNL